ncbi:MAG: 5'-deoxynucleotidase [Oscillospiraceae bacterium]|nr:5'-deoxynucleotidase [Oscillospiraceae bacterium]
MHHFFAYISRMRHIRRWSLMRNSLPENDLEHAAMTAILAHALAVIRNDSFGGHVNPDRCAALALYHDVSEVITGDIATPIKYFNPGIAAAHREIERASQEKLLSMVPAPLSGYYRSIIQPDPSSDEWRVVKAADNLAAHLKCVEELAAGNEEFRKASAATLKKVRALAMPEVDLFMEEYAPSFGLALDELN